MVDPSHKLRELLPPHNESIYCIGSWGYFKLLIFNTLIMKHCFNQKQLWYPILQYLFSFSLLHILIHWIASFQLTKTASCYFERHFGENLYSSVANVVFNTSFVTDKGGFPVLLYYFLQFSGNYSQLGQEHISATLLFSFSFSTICTLFTTKLGKCNLHENRTVWLFCG